MLTVEIMASLSSEVDFFSSSVSDSFNIISSSNILFINATFDEFAVCHVHLAAVGSDVEFMGFHFIRQLAEVNFRIIVSCISYYVCQLLLMIRARIELIFFSERAGKNDLHFIKNFGADKIKLL